MGAVEDFSAYVAGQGVFVQLQKLVVDHNFMVFSEKIRRALEDPDVPNKDVLLLLIKDALDTLGPSDSDWDVAAIESLANEYLPGYADPPPEPQSSAEPLLPPVIKTPLESGVIQLRRVVQVTMYGNAKFADSSTTGLQRTIYCSPQERTFHKAVLLRYPGLFALPNYPIASAINTEWLRHVVSRREFAFAMRSSLDTLLVTPGEGDPIIGFELDSAYHDVPEARERDKMKDKLLHLAGIPLVRLRVEDSESMTVDDWYAVLADQVGDIPVPKRHRCREQSLSFAPIATQ